MLARLAETTFTTRTILFHRYQPRAGDVMSTSVPVEVETPSRSLRGRAAAGSSPEPHPVVRGAAEVLRA